MAGYAPAVAETPRELYERSAGALRLPDLDEWGTWPFAGELVPRALEAPGPERARDGEEGPCSSCARPDEGYIWTDDTWRLFAFEPNGLPVVVLLEPREHYDTVAELPGKLARRMGVMLGRVERAVLSVGGIERVHICRFGEGGTHLHWWFIARPAGFPQLASGFAMIWDDVLPPTPQDVWDANLARVVEALRA